jgi:DNA-directed RNA polymerase subunit RPC12/RpoP
MVSFESPCGDYGGSEPDERDATPADLIAALSADPELRAIVLAALPEFAAGQTCAMHARSALVATKRAEVAERQAEELRGQLEAARAELERSVSIDAASAELGEALSELRRTQAELERVKTENANWERHWAAPCSGCDWCGAPAEPKPAEHWPSRPTCPNCKGSCFEDGNTSQVRCRTCGGRGVVEPKPTEPALPTARLDGGEGMPLVDFQSQFLANSAEAVLVARRGLELYERIASALERLERGAKGER